MEVRYTRHEAGMQCDIICDLCHQPAATYTVELTTSVGAPPNLDLAELACRQAVYKLVEHETQFRTVYFGYDGQIDIVACAACAAPR